MAKFCPITNTNEYFNNLKKMTKFTIATTIKSQISLFKYLYLNGNIIINIIYQFFNNKKVYPSPLIEKPLSVLDLAKVI